MMKSHIKKSIMDGMIGKNISDVVKELEDKHLIWCKSFSNQRSTNATTLIYRDVDLYYDENTRLVTGYKVSGNPDFPEYGGLFLED